VTALHAVAPYGPSAPSVRVRVVEWLRRTDPQAALHTYLGGPRYSVSTLARHPLAAAQCEYSLRRLPHQLRRSVLLLHREASPLSGGSVEARLLSAAAYGIYDFDDALQWDWGRDSLLRSLRPKAPKALSAVRAADRVLAGNDYLADWATSCAKDVVVIPTCVDLGDYVEKTDYGLHDPPRLGWLGAPLNQNYVTQIGPALLEVHRQTGARLTMIGAEGPLGSLDPIVDRVPWSMSSVRAALAEWDIGLNPLRDGSWERGKCAYKLLQYGAAGVPSVGSPVGVAANILASVGLPAPRTRDEWVDALVNLLGVSAASRAAAGHRFRAHVSAEFSYGAWHDRWLATSLGNRLTQP
jgi:glycosyltransferase involved in cell wall biosynthesis